MKIINAKKALDKIINKARIHFYKPIQIAEILYQDRISQNLVLTDLSTYRVASRRWRDEICIKFLGRTSTSSSRYQDDLFNQNAIPPEVLAKLGEENVNKSGIVEAYIYRKFHQKYSQMTAGLRYCQQTGIQDFQLSELLSSFWTVSGLRRSIDKVYEIVVYALFKILVEELEINITIAINFDQLNILQEFEDFTQKVLSIDSQSPILTVPAQFNRAGVTNAADRGLDMWANYGSAVQIKHLSLTETLAESMVSNLTADRIILVCKDSEEKTILALLNQIGWKARIQSIITQSDLEVWYAKAMQGEFAHLLGEKVKNTLIEEIQYEFPTSDPSELTDFIETRGYTQLNDPLWTL